MTAPLSAADLANRLNLHRAVRGWRGACPACSYADAFSLRAGKADRIALFCANCGDRDAITDAVHLAVGGDWTAPAAGVQADAAGSLQRNQDRARRLWNGSIPAAGTIADTYLSNRALPGLAASSALRFRRDCPHPEGRALLPALMAEVVDVAGRFLALHRTFLQRNGSGKADIEPQRATLAAFRGGAVRLAPVAEEVLVGEGIETSASAGQMLALPAWAALSAGNLAQGLVLPAEVRAVVIAADADAPGERAAKSAALRWRREGRTVRIARPEKAGCDFNDILRGGESA